MAFDCDGDILEAADDTKCIIQEVALFDVHGLDAGSTGTSDDLYAGMAGDRTVELMVTSVDHGFRHLADPRSTFGVYFIAQRVVSGRIETLRSGSGRRSVRYATNMRSVRPPGSVKL